MARSSTSFVKGQHHGLPGAGRPIDPLSPRQLFRSFIAGHTTELLQLVYESAKKGDTAAARWMLTYAIGQPPTYADIQHEEEADRTAAMVAQLHETPIETVEMLEADEEEEEIVNDDGEVLDLRLPAYTRVARRIAAQLVETEGDECAYPIGIRRADASL